MLTFKFLYSRRSSTYRIAPEATLVDQKRGDRLMDHLQYRRKQLRMDGEEVPQRDRERHHLLAHRQRGDDLVNQMGGGFGHAPRA